MLSVQKIKAMVIVFDQGNTLLMDPFPSVIESCKKRLRQLCYLHGIQVDATEIVLEWTRANKSVNYPYIGHFYQEEPIVQRALRNLGVTDEVAAILGLEMLKEYRIWLAKWIRREPRTQEVRATLQELRGRGKKLGVFSNDRMVALGFVLNLMGIRSFFDYVETSESIGIEKPDPRVFEHILRYFQLEPSLIVYVGDEPIRDVETAKSQGLKVIQHIVDVEAFSEDWRNYRNVPTYGPDATINQFSELLDILE